jgi:tetraacyldisaccharide 4'-kinase
MAKTYQGLSVLKRGMTRERKAPIPVICVGNLTLGGAGKTPTARALLDLVAEHGKFATPCFLMRGFGGRHKGPLEVDVSQHTSWDVGDEALMQSRYAPVIISADRYRGALLAQRNGYDLIIMDDGFQNPRLKKDLSFIVIDGGFGFGNGKCFPSGPLREPVESGIKRAQAAIIVNKTEGVDLSALGDFRQYQASIALDNPVPKHKKRKVIALAGIARPEKFFETLEANCYHLYAHYAFPDHHTYTHDQLKKIETRAKKANVGMITTEKDWVRFSEKWQGKIDRLTITITLSERFKSAFFRALDKL